MELAILFRCDECMIFREPLPEGCPPQEAEEVTESRIVFRLVRGDPPKESDFSSQRAEKPQNQFNVPECVARGVSVFSELGEAKKQLMRPTHKGKLVCRITLNKGAGRILTGRKSHITWWPLADFDILNHC